MYTFYDVLEIVDSSRLRVLERYLLIRSIDELVSVKPDLTKVKECLHELFNKIPKKSTTLQMISVEEIKKYRDNSTPRDIRETHVVLKEPIRTFNHHAYTR